jgi:ABC-type transport system substrate-binding protein
MKIWHKLLVTVQALCLLTLVGCKVGPEPAAEYPRGETLYLGGMAAKSADWPSSSNCALVFETLFRFDASTKSLQPLLASRLLENPNSLEITLNPSARYSNGAKVSSADVIFAWQNAAPNVNLNRVDSGHILITSINPKLWNSAVVKDGLTHIQIKPQNKTPQGSQPIGSGPYLISQVFPSKVVLLRNDHYWAGTIHAPKFIIHSDFNSRQHMQSALERGHLDIAQDTGSEQGIDLVIAHKTKPWGNTLVRKALALAVHADSSKDSLALALARKQIAFLLSSQERSPQTLLYSGDSLANRVQKICTSLAWIGITLQPKELDSVSYAKALAQDSFALALVSRPFDPSLSAIWRRARQVWNNEGTQGTPLNPKVLDLLKQLSASPSAAQDSAILSGLLVLADQDVPSLELSKPVGPTWHTSQVHWSIPANLIKIDASSLQALQRKRLDLN